jgi:hypothetical protein
MGQLSATEIARKGGFVLQRCLLDWSFHRDAIEAVRWWAAVFTRARSIFPQPCNIPQYPDTVPETTEIITDI